jgi:hypothetical protein
MQNWADAEREAFSLRETLMFGAATGFRDEGGLMVGNSLLATDGRAYKISEQLSISVQDERGLLGINTTDERALARFFASIGVPAEDHARLSDALLDFIDPDDLRRLKGAEKAEYARANLPPPANDYLRTREQLRDVIGWADLLAKLAVAEPRFPGIQARFLDLFSTARHIGLNVNSAPAAVLAAVPGVDPAKVASLLDQRRAKAFRSIADLAPFTNGPVDSDYLGLVGANEWRVTVRKADLPFLLECQLSITPAEPDRPTRLKECFRRPETANSPSVPDEFQRALAPNTNLRSTPESVSQRSSNLAPRNELREATLPVESVPPKWLADALPTKQSARQ